MAVRTLSGLVSLRIVKASSWDTQPRIITTNPTSSSSSSPANINSFPSFNTHIFKKRMISLNKNSQTQTKKPSSSSSSTKKKPSVNVSKLLELNNPTIPKQEQEDEFYLGSERWLPTPPKVNNPRSIYNAASLAYIGDCIYELYARRHFLFPALSIEECNDRVMAVVRCEAQDALLKRLLREDFLSEEERDLLRWGKNIDSGKTRTTKRAGVAVYNRASSLETLVGYLYLTNTKRLEEVMLKLGFTTAASNQLIMEDVLKKPEEAPRHRDVKAWHFGICKKH